MENKKYNLTVINEMFWQAFPALFLSTVTSVLSGVINGLITGNFFSSESLAALGFVSPFVQILSSIGAIIGAGARVESGRALGRGESGKVDKIYSSSIITASFIGILLTIVIFAFANPISYALGARDEVVSLSALYTRGIALGMLPTMITPSLMVFLQMFNDANKTFISTVILVVCNLVFSLLNATIIKGGVFGMGIATTLSQVISMLYLFICLKKKGVVKFDAKLFNIKETITMIVVGSPSGLAQILYATRNIILNQQAQVILGVSAVTALAITFSTAGVFDAVNIATKEVTISLSAIFAGEKDKESLKTLFKVSNKNGIIMAICKVIIIFITGRYLCTAFGAKGEVIDLAYSLYIFYSYAMPINILVCALSGIYQSLGKTKFLNILQIFSAFLFPVGWTLATKFVFGINALWSSFLMAEVFTLIAIFVVSLIKYKRVPTTIEDWLLIDSDYSYDKKLAITVKSVDEVVTVASKVEQFCKENDIDTRRSMMCGLCLEEIAGNVVEHGFTKSNKARQSVDIFVALDKDDLTLRIRDNAVAFDPRVKLGIKSDDPCKNIGIKMVNKLAKDMTYQSYFGMNVLVIKL